MATGGIKSRKRPTGVKTMETVDQVLGKASKILNAIGGAAQYYARCIRRVKDVHFLEFGIPEAMWHLEVEDFPAIVTMDAAGNSLHADVETASGAILAHLADPVF